MRSLLRQMRPDNFEDISAVIALYRPGPDGDELAHQLRAAQERPAEGRAHPPRAGGAARGDPGHHLRPDRLPGAGAARRAEAGRLHARPGRPAAPRDGQEEEGGPGQGVRPLPGRHARARLLRRRHPGASGTCWCRSPGTPSTRRTPPRTASSPTGPPTSRRTTRPSTWPALLTSVRDDKDKSALYLGECRHMGITVLPPDVNSSSANFTAVGKDIRFGLTAVRNVGANVVDAIVRAREEKGAFTSFTDFLDKVPAVVCNKRTIESLIKAGAFDSLGHARRALLLVHEQAVDSVIGVKRKEAEGQFDLFADLDGRRRRRAGLRGRRAGPAGLGQEAAARVRAGDARPVRVGPPAVRARARARRARRTCRSPRCCRRAAAGRLDGGRRRPHHLAAAQDVASRATRGPRSRSRTWRARSRSCSSARPTWRTRRRSPRTRSW